MNIAELVKQALSEVQEEIKEEIKAENKAQYKQAFNTQESLTAKPVIGITPQKLTPTKRHNLVVEYKETKHKPKYMNEYELEEILKDFKNGLFIKDIAQKTKLPIVCIESLLWRNILVKRRGRGINWTNEEHETLLNMKDQGAAIDEIALKLNRSLKGVYIQMCKIRDGRRGHRRNLNELSRDKLYAIPKKIKKEDAQTLLNLYNEGTSMKELATLMKIHLFDIEKFIVANHTPLKLFPSRRWTEEERKTVIKMRGDDAAIDEIAKYLKNPYVFEAKNRPWQKGICF